MRKDELGDADVRVRGGLVEQLARVTVAANVETAFLDGRVFHGRLRDGECLVLCAVCEYVTRGNRESRSPSSRAALVGRRASMRHCANGPSGSEATICDI